MPGVEHLLSGNRDVKLRRRALVVSILVGAIVLHVAAGVVAGIFVVAKYMFPEPATFEVKRDFRLPAKQREHKMAMAAFDALTPKPSFSDKMQSQRPTAFALPDIPKIPMDQILPLDPAQLVSDQVAGLAGASGIGNGAGSGGFGGGGLGPGGVSFLGIQSVGQRILLLFDVSTSVVNKAAKAGLPLTRIREETATLITKLPIASRFGIIQFTQNYKPFKSELVPATDANRAAALDWIGSEWVETGAMPASKRVTSNHRGFAGVLELAATMQPDVIFLISDASFQWKPSGKIEDIPWPELHKIAEASFKSAPGGCKIHFIGVEMKKEDQREISAIVRKSGGKIREIQ